MEKVQLVSWRELGGKNQRMRQGDFVKCCVVDGHRLVTECGVLLSDWRTRRGTWAIGDIEVMIKPRVRM